MEPIVKFKCKIRRNKSGQTLLTIPKVHREKFREDQPVIVMFYCAEKKKVGSEN